MPLTPEDVVQKEFQHVRFKDGFDPDEVDDFLDEIVVEWRKTVDENADLKAQLADVQAGAPVAVAPQQGEAVASSDASLNSASIIALAQRLHDEHVAEGEAKKAELIASGEQQKQKLVSDAQAQATQLLSETQEKHDKQKAQLEQQQAQLEAKVKELREFEAAYRSQLRTLIQSHLNDLAASSPE